MATSSVAVTEGTGKNIATNSITEDSKTKEISRMVLNDSSGAELSPLTISDFDTKTGALTETAPATDTASSGLNGRLQRIAQRLTSMIALLPTALGQTTKSASLPVTLASDDDSQGKLGALTETAPATDTASSGLNGRLQRVAQRITSLIALLPTALGQTTMSASLPVVLPSNQTAIPATSAGDIAAGATDSGNPVKVGGKYNSTQPTLTDGQRGDMQLTSRGNLRAELYSGAQGINQSGGNLLVNVQNFGITTYGNSDGNSAGITSAIVFNYSQLFNGATWDRERTPTTFKSATATASGDTALWTPTSGKKFRLQRFRIEITADAATSGGADIDITLRDSTTATAAIMSVFVPAVAGTAFGNTVSTGWIDIGNGILSAAANNVLNINLSAALTAGKVRVIACGTEE